MEGLLTPPRGDYRRAAEAEIVFLYRAAGLAPPDRMRSGLM